MLYQKIVEVITPYTGASVARAAVERQAEAMGLTSESVTPEHLPELADGVTMGLSAFIGQDLAGRAGQLIKALA